MLKRLLLLLIPLCFGCATQSLAAETGIPETERQLLDAVNSGIYDHLSVGQLRDMLQQQRSGGTSAAVETHTNKSVEANSVIAQRSSSETLAASLPFSIVPHKRNYLLPVTYNRHTNGKSLAINDEHVDRFEVKFQFSFKVPVWQNVLGDADLWAAYTNLSFWQAYNQAFSSPFRETNHEPELFLSIANDTRIFGLTNSLIMVGINHQSNGRGGEWSRSWNRAYINVILERGDFVISLQPWYRFKEHRDDDDNPDIARFLGYGEMRLGYKWNRHVFSLMLRNNLRQSKNKGAIQVDWTFPLSKHLKGYVQYFNGYGESLVDYNISTNRIGCGIVLTDLF